MQHTAEKLFREVALEKFREGLELVVIGHVHLPYEKELDGKKFLIVGDWIDNLSYLVMERGEITSHRNA